MQGARNVTGRHTDVHDNHVILPEPLSDDRIMPQRRAAHASCVEDLSFRDAKHATLVLTVTLSARSTCCHDAYFARVPDRPDGWCRQQAAQSMHAFVLGEYEKNAQPLSRSQRSLQAAGVSNNDA